MVKLPKRFSVGERVFAKVRGYPPWPAKIESVEEQNTKNPKYHVLFYGTRETGICKIEDLFQYAENKDKFSKTTKRKLFRDGLVELEEDLKKNPDPATEANKVSEAVENVPQNVGASDKGSESVVSSADGDADGNLVIDEDEKKKGVKRKLQSLNTPDVPEVKKKRGRKSMSTILAESTPKPDSAHDSQDEDLEKKVVSRSGRKIKPKRFHDYSDAEIALETSKTDQSTRNRTKSKSEDNENQDVPVTPIKKRMSIEKDDKKSLAATINYEVDDDIELRVKTLRIESHLKFLDTQIRSSLSLDQANTDDCLEAMDKVMELKVEPLMLKKHPHIVETVKRLRRYVGNLTDWKLSEEETKIFKEKAELIKEKAGILYNKFKQLFFIPEGKLFWDFFIEQLEEFKKHTKDMTQEEVFSLLVDPTESKKLKAEAVAKVEITKNEPVPSTSSQDVSATEIEAK